MLTSNLPEVPKAADNSSAIDRASNMVNQVATLAHGLTDFTRELVEFEIAIVGGETSPVDVLSHDEPIDRAAFRATCLADCLLNAPNEVKRITAEGADELNNMQNALARISKLLHNPKE